MYFLFSCSARSNGMMLFKRGTLIRVILQLFLVTIFHSNCYNVIVQRKTCLQVSELFRLLLLSKQIACTTRIVAYVLVWTRVPAITLECMMGLVQIADARPVDQILFTDDCACHYCRVLSVIRFLGTSSYSSPLSNYVYLSRVCARVVRYRPSQQQRHQTPGEGIGRGGCGKESFALK